MAKRKSAKDLQLEQVAKQSSDNNILIGALTDTMAFFVNKHLVLKGRVAKLEKRVAKLEGAKRAKRS